LHIHLYIQLQLSQKPTKPNTQKLLHLTANMKFQYLATAITLFAIALAGPVNFPRQGTGNMQLSCNGTTAAECNKAWWTFCSVEGNIVMPARDGWKDGDCTHKHCNCIDASSQVTPRATVDGTEDLRRPRPVTHTHSHESDTAIFTRPTETLPPKTVTIVPATTPIPGSFIWK
jgi:hypothetical protein